MRMVPRQDRELLPKGEIFQKEVAARSKRASEERKQQHKGTRHPRLYHRKHSRLEPDGVLATDNYRTPEEFRQAGYANVESKERFPHPHSHDDGGCEVISQLNQNRETPVISG